MGTVWVAHHETLDIEVAVKFILPDAATGTLGDAAVARFRREAQLAAKIDSPHVVRMLDHGIAKSEGADVPYIVMELLRGESVAERLAAGRLPPAEVVRIVSDVAEGLERAHELGVVHRDIKPQNLFLTRPKDVVKVLDFGIARSSQAASDGAADDGSATSTGAIVGTPFYMSPEQLLEAKTPDQSADVWALAVVAYELLTGQRPFSGETPARTMMLITQAKFERVSRVADLPESADAFFERTFAPERDRRFATALALADGLRAALSGVTGSAVAPARTIPDPAGDAGAALGTGEFVRTAGLDVASDTPAMLEDVRRPAPIVDGPMVTLAAPAPRRSKSLLVAGVVALAALGAGVAIFALSARTPPAPPPVLRRADTGPDGASPPSAVAATIGPETPSASASAASSASAPIYLPCDKAAATRCAPGSRSWCTLDAQVIACCASGLAPVGPDRCACPTGGTDVKALIESGCSEPKQVDVEGVKSHVRGRMEDLKKCYEEALAKNPRLKGDLALHVEVAPDGVVGRVTFANASAPDPDFQDCARRVMESIRFEPPVNGSFAFTYPLSFSPG